MKWLLLVVVGGCASPVVEPDAEPDSEPIATYQFTFAVVADPHLASNPEHVGRFRDALDWIDAEADSRGIEVVLLAGDVAWHDGFPDVQRLLSDAAVPIAPVIGDNEVNSGNEERYHDALSEHYVALQSTLDGWHMAERPVHNPQHNQDSWLFNFAFEHGDVRFIGLDWSPRNETDRVLSEMGTLHDFEGGTLPFLVDELSDATQALDDSVVLLTHQPMYVGVGGFFLPDWGNLTNAIRPYEHLLGVNAAGHLHVNAEVEPDDLPIDVWITDALWDDAVTVRLVDVWSDGMQVTYETETVTVGVWP